MRWSVARAERALDRIPPRAVAQYRRYWARLTPAEGDLVARYRRWQFAIASVQSGVGTNLSLYLWLRENTALGFSGRCSAYSFDRLLRAAGKGGMYGMRAPALWHLDSTFSRDPDWWARRPGESFATARARVAAGAPGLGLAKAAFGLEMLEPECCQVACLDRHHLRLYGLGQEASEADYFRSEGHWVRAAAARGYPAALARHVWWDRRRTPAQDDTRYWSYVFELPEVVG